MTAPAAADAPRVLADIALEIDPDEILRFQGYKRGVDVPGPEVQALLDEALALGRRLIEPRAVVHWVAVTRREGDTLEAGGVALTVPGIERAWGPVAELAEAVCTIGDPLERRGAELWEARELPLAVMLDSVGSGAVESLAEYVNDVLCQEGIARGLKVTNRISPGYGAWDVAQQQVDLAPGRRGGHRARRPLLQPVRPLLDARLRLSPRPRPEDRAPVKPRRDGGGPPRRVSSGRWLAAGRVNRPLAASARVVEEGLPRPGPRSHERAI